MDTNTALETDQADVTIVTPVEKEVDWENLAAVEDDPDIYTLKQNEIPFVIRLNIGGINMTEGATLPTFVDRLSEEVEFIESSLKVTIGGEDYPFFTYQVGEDAGRQILFIDGLPDDKTIIITYRVKITVPNKVIQVDNTAYWNDHSIPDEPQAKINARYYLSNMTITIEEKNGRDNENFLYHITGKTQNGEDVDLTVSVKGGSSSTIVFPPGEYTVEEVPSWSWKYGNKDTYGKDDEEWALYEGDLTKASTSLSYGENEHKTVIYEHDRNARAWLGGENYRDNHFDNTVTP